MANEKRVRNTYGFVMCVKVLRRIVSDFSLIESLNAITVPVVRLTYNLSLKPHFGQP